MGISTVAYLAARIGHLLRKFSFLDRINQEQYVFCHWTVETSTNQPPSRKDAAGHQSIPGRRYILLLKIFGRSTRSDPDWPDQIWMARSKCRTADWSYQIINTYLYHLESLVNSLKDYQLVCKGLWNNLCQTCKFNIFQWFKILNKNSTLVLSLYPAVNPSAVLLNVSFPAITKCNH